MGVCAGPNPGVSRISASGPGPELVPARRTCPADSAAVRGHGVVPCHLLWAVHQLLQPQPLVVRHRAALGPPARIIIRLKVDKLEGREWSGRPQEMDPSPQETDPPQYYLGHAAPHSGYRDCSPGRDSDTVTVTGPASAAAASAGRTQGSRVARVARGPTGLLMMSASAARALIQIPSSIAQSVIVAAPVALDAARHLAVIRVRFG